MIKILTDRAEYEGLDVAKFVFAVFIVILHIEPFKNTNPMMNEIFTNGITRVSVPFFFMCTGFFLGKAEKVHGQSVYKKKALSLLRLYIIWSLIYFIWPLTETILVHRNGIIYGFMGWIKNSVLCGSYGQLWYLKGTAVALLLFYILRRNNANISAMFLGVALYLIGLLNQSANIILLMISQKNEFLDIIDNIYRSIFSTTRNGVFFGFLFVTMGVAIANVDEYKIRMQKLKIIVISLISVFFLLAESFLTKETALNRDMYIFLIPATLFIFLLTLGCKNDLGKRNQIYNKLRYFSKVIFFIHYWVYDALKWLLFKNNFEFENYRLPICVVTLILSLLVGEILIIMHNNKKLCKMLSVIGL